jgi:hypothetical protein
MANRKKNSSDNAALWSPTAIRLTAFLSPNQDPIKQNWWEEIFTSPPENRNTKPRTLEQTDEGAFENGKVTLNLTQGRIDWLYNATESGTENFQFAMLGTFQENLDIFIEIVDKWFALPSLPSLQRLAFGTVLLHPVNSLVEGYDLLEGFLPSIKINTKNASDFLFQINRPRPSKTNISGLEINRVAKWAVLSLNASILKPNSPVVNVPEIFAAHLELDINTSQRYKENIPTDKLSNIFIEMVDLGKEITQKGDIE